MGTTLGRADARLGLAAIFGSTFLGLIGYFMLLPLLLLRLKGADVSSTVAGLFAACGWAGIFLCTPFSSWIVQKLGRRQTLWIAAGIPALAAIGFASTDALPFWFGLELLAGAASGLRWVLAEAVVAEFAPSGQRGRYVGLFETMIGTTFVIGPALLVAIGPSRDGALWTAIAFIVAGWIWAFLVPAIPPAADAETAHVGIRGVWFALVQHPIIMMAGFVGGFFESGITSILPLYGLALGLSAAAAALLVAASGLGSALMMLPVGLIADRFDDPSNGRRSLMVALAGVTFVATIAVPFVAQISWLAWPIVFLWGGAGGSLYTLAMIDIGTRASGVTLVNSTAVLVLTYTLGGMLASASSGFLLQWSPTVGFSTVLALVSGLGCLALWRTRRAGSRAAQ
ncbi:MAG: MFS transporter [Burkholderiaceae bacterium]